MSDRQNIDIYSHLNADAVLIGMMIRHKLASRSSDVQSRCSSFAIMH